MSNLLPEPVHVPARSHYNLNELMRLIHHVRQGHPLQPIHDGTPPPQSPGAPGLAALGIDQWSGPSPSGPSPNPYGQEPVQGFPVHRPVDPGAGGLGGGSPVVPQPGPPPSPSVFGSQPVTGQPIPQGGGGSPAVPLPGPPTPDPRVSGGLHPMPIHYGGPVPPYQLPVRGFPHPGPHPAVAAAHAALMGFA